MNKKRIAVLTRAGYSYHQDVSWGFLSSVEEQKETLNWRPILFLCKEANERVMIEQMREIEDDGNYDLIISIGAMRTSIAHRYMQEHQWKTPLIFAGVTDPVTLGVLDSLQSTQQVTGVVREEIALEQIGLLLRALKPSVQSILIPYYRHAENGAIEAQLTALKATYQACGINLRLMPLDSVKKLPEAFHMTLQNVDTLWCLGGSFLEVFSEHLIKLCNQYNVTYFSNTAATANQGAAISFGSDVSIIGKKVFSHAYSILEKKVEISTLPITHIPNDRQIIINSDACQLQGVPLDPTLLFILQNGCFLENSTGD